MVWGGGGAVLSAWRWFRPRGGGGLGTDVLLLYLTTGVISGQGDSPCFMAHLLVLILSLRLFDSVPSLAEIDGLNRAEVKALAEDPL